MHPNTTSAFGINNGPPGIYAPATYIFQKSCDEVTIVLTAVPILRTLFCTHAKTFLYASFTRNQPYWHTDHGLHRTPAPMDINGAYK